MTDRELLEQALEALQLVVWTNNPPVNKAITALRERLAQPQQWEQFYPDIGNPFKVRSCAECGKSGGWALYCVACMDKMARDDDDTQVYRSELEAAVKAERAPLLEALTAICVKCRSNEWGPTTPRKEILNWMHDHASAAIRARGAKT